MNSAIVYGKKIGGKPAREKHGIQGWQDGELVIFYEGLGWVNKQCLEEDVKKANSQSMVFASRTSFIPAEARNETVGWRQGLPRRRRFKVVFFSNLGWVSYKRRLEGLEPDQAELLVPAC